MVLHVFLLAAFEWSLPFGAEAGMMAGAAVPDWRHGSFTNPAALANTEKIAAGIVFTEPHGLDGLGASGGSFALRIRDLCFGVMLRGLWFGDYREFDPGAAFAVVLPGSWAAGVGLHGLMVSEAGGEIRFAPAVDVGLGWVKGAFGLTSGLRRLNQPRFENGDMLAAQLFGGMVWRPAVHLTLAADFERTQEYESVRLGMEFEPVSGLCLRAGVCSEPLSYAGGAALSTKELTVDYALRFHPCLGGTHQLGLVWRRH